MRSRVRKTYAFHSVEVLYLIFFRAFVFAFILIQKIISILDLQSTKIQNLVDLKVAIKIDEVVSCVYWSSNLRNDSMT